MNGIYQYTGEAGVFEGLSPEHAKMRHDACALDLINDDGHTKARQREDVEGAILEASAAVMQVSLGAIAARAREAKERAGDVLDELTSMLKSP